MDLHDPYMFMEWVVVGWWVVLQVGWLDYLSNQIQILKNCHFGLKKNPYPPRWICMTHIWFPTEFLGEL